LDGAGRTGPNRVPALARASSCTAGAACAISSWWRRRSSGVVAVCDAVRVGCSVDTQAEWDELLKREPSVGLQQPPQCRALEVLGEQMRMRALQHRVEPA
jgi:hypothetical protein